jgi:Tol biopolymer transport system component
MILSACPSRPSDSCVIDRGVQGQLIFYVLDLLKGQGKEVTRTKLERANDLNFSISPDGSQIAVASEDQLRGQIRILNLQNHSERSLRLPQGSDIHGINWAADGNALVAQIQTTEHLIVRMDLDGKIHILIERQHGMVGDPCLVPDGRHLAYFQRTFEDNVWLLENF